MDRRVNVCGEAKESSSGAVAKASLKMANQSQAFDPKPRDLPMGRVHPE
jgi:hypothetical protein